jgi:hypothetical protein
MEEAAEGFAETAARVHTAWPFLVNGPGYGMRMGEQKAADKAEEDKRATEEAKEQMRELEEGDPPEDLVELGKREIEQLGLAKASKVERGFVTRVPKAYPMYDEDYSERVDVIKDWLAGVGNLQQVGRNGLHRYNNSDHSMLTAIRAVENITRGTRHDLWAVNAESAYHEEHQEPEQPYRRVPKTVYEREPLHAGQEAAA